MTKEISLDKALKGLCCTGCGIKYKVAHGYPVYCSQCWSTARQKIGEHRIRGITSDTIDGCRTAHLRRE